VSEEAIVEGGVLPFTSLIFLHHRYKTGGIDKHLPSGPGNGYRSGVGFMMQS